MSTLLKSIPQKIQILILASSLFFLFILQSLVSSTQMASIQKELVSIAEEDMPLTEITTQLTTHYLEMTIYFERGIRLAEKLQENPSLRSHFNTVKGEYDEYLKKVDEEIIKAEELLAEIIILETEHGNDELVEEFTKLLSLFKQAESDHLNFKEQSQNIWLEIQSNGTVPSETVLEETEELASLVDHELAEILIEIETFTAQAILNAQEHEESAFIMGIWLTVIGVIIGSSIAYFIIKNMTQNLELIINSTKHLADDNLGLEVESFPANTEIGQLSLSLKILRQNLIDAKIAREKTAQLEKEKTDLERKETQAAAIRAQEEAKFQEQKAKALDHLVHGFETSISGILQEVNKGCDNLDNSANSISNGAIESRKQSEQAKIAAEQMSQSLQTISASAEQMSASISEISQQSLNSAKVAQEGVERTRKTSDTINRLAENVAAIDDIVNLINDISEQTNLLALNATIEAARAGDAGRGFAVVASEVKALATQTGEATEEVRKQIGLIQTDSKETLDSIKGIEKTVSAMEENATIISSAVEEQTASTTEISRNLNEITGAANQISQVISSNDEQSEQGAKMVMDVSQDVNANMFELKDNINKFIEGVKEV